MWCTVVGGWCRTGTVWGPGIIRIVQFFFQRVLGGGPQKESIQIGPRFFFFIVSFFPPFFTGLRAEIE